MAARYSDGGVLSGYTPITGSLPFNGGGAGAFAGLGGSPQQAMASLGANYANAYNASLSQNRSNYEDIMRGYQQTLAAQTSAQEATAAGYTSLYNDVMSGIKGIGASRDQAINDQAAQAQGAGTQSLINRGLGNTTVQDSVNRGVTADKNKALTENANAVAGLTAGYQSSIGQARLQQQSQATMANSALSQNQLQFMNSISAGYPNAGAYGSLAQQFGQASAAQRNADKFGRIPTGGAMSGLPGGGGRGPQLGYVPTGAGIGAGGGYNAPGGFGSNAGFGQWATGVPSAGGGGNVFGSYSGGDNWSTGSGAPVEDFGGGFTNGGGGFNFAGAGGSIGQGAAYGDYSFDDYGGGGDY